MSIFAVGNWKLVGRGDDQFPIFHIDIGHRHHHITVMDIGPIYSKTEIQLL
eukprot:gene12553-20618_t